jgi:pimeloyl-ACP methyl ester carboxylesterase
MTSSIWLDLMGAGVRECFYDVGGVRTRVLEAGDHGPVLMLLHGTGGHAETYCRNLGPLSERFRVRAPDLIGHGYTDRPPDLDYALDDFAGHVLGLLDALGAGRAHLSGESLGAMVCAWTAIVAPDRVDRVVMNTGTLARPDAAGQAQLDDLERRTRALAEEGATEENVRHRMNWLVSDPARMTDEMVAVRLRIYQQPGMLDTAATIMSRVVGMIRGDHGERYMAPGVLHRLTRPALVLWTQDNPGQSAALARRTTAAIPDARFEVLEDCAHWPQFERPDVFNARHLTFLAGERPA